MSSRGFTWLTLAIVTTIVAWTCWPVVEVPQLEPDDFRYLSLIEQLQAGLGAGLPESFVVENRWDHLWYVETDAVLRFFRPTVLTSFWLDKVLWKDPITGLCWSNVILFLTSAVLVVFVLKRMLKDRLAVLFGSALYAALFAHGECIWYVSGRTETLAAIGFLAGLALWIQGPDRRRLRQLAIVAYAFALFTKELTAALPVVCLLWDRWIERREGSLYALLKRDAKLWIAWGSVAVGYFVLRQVVLGRTSAGQLIEPYFVSPLSANFPGHLWMQLRSYVGNLVAAEVTPPFMKPEDLAAWSTLTGWILGSLAMLGAGFLVVREPLARLLAALAVLTWLPTCFVYVSERYLLLPSLAVAGLAALGLAKLRTQPIARWAGIAVLLLWTGHQASLLRLKHVLICQSPRVANATMQHLQTALPHPPAKGATILFIAYPGDDIAAQFLEPHMRCFFHDPTLRVHVLSVLPQRERLPQPVTVKRLGPSSLELRGTPSVMAHGNLFKYVDYASRTPITSPRLGFTATVLDGDATACRAVRFDFERPLRECLVLRFHRWPADFDKDLEHAPKGIQISRCSLEVLRP
ncbi:MAG: hypothetical protein CMJ85_10545 [Planctomycetes bacterium]|nr:hypothetical protein [Planctomycetota bacterium]MDP6425336.1 hypothetical protein [Planctomycetota bacterium]